MRLLAYAAVALAAAVLAGCAGDDGDAEPVWGGPPGADAGGLVSVDGFEAHQGEVDELWEGSAAMAAAEFLRLDERVAARTTIEARASAEGTGPQTVIVTLDGLFDDSVRAERWTLGFEQRDDETYVLTAALREQRCQQGRGHRDFSAGRCV